MPRLAIAAALAWAPAGAGAHAFIRRYDLPLPLGHYMAGAGAVVVLTFAALALFAGRQRTVAAPLRIDLTGTRFGRLTDSRGLRRVLGVLSVSVFVFVVTAGLIGAQHDPFANILPVTVWVGWWVGLAFTCALLGNVWPAINPLAPGGRPKAHRAYPRWLGAWPAAAGFLLFAWAELIWPDSAVPWKLAVAILAYSGMTFAGMAVYGRDAWLANAETFTVLFGLFGRFAIIGRDAGRLVLRPFGAGLDDERPLPSSTAVFVVLVLATVSFDGFLHTPAWRAAFDALFDAGYDAGLIARLGNTGTRTLILTAGLIAAPAVFLCVYGITCACVAALGRAGGPRVPTVAVACRFALALVPIAVAYHLSHYLSLLLIEGQRFVALASDPFGYGWNVFGTAGRQPDIAAADARLLWNVSVGAIVVGHAIAIWLAHAAAQRLFGDHRRALRSQLPMLVLMVGYTMLSLWILAQPIVAEP